MVSLYGPPNQNLLNQSYQAVYSCAYRGQENLTVVDVKLIESVVAVIPHELSINQISDPNMRSQVQGKVFVVEKLGLDVMLLAELNHDEHDPEIDDDEEGIPED